MLCSSNITHLIQLHVLVLPLAHRPHCVYAAEHATVGRAISQMTIDKVFAHVLVLVIQGVAMRVPVAVPQSGIQQRTLVLITDDLLLSSVYSRCSLQGVRRADVHHVSFTTGVAPTCALFEAAIYISMLKG